MSEQEYNERLSKIELAFEAEKKKLYWDYGISQAKFKVGDIIKDHRWIIKIERITVSKWFDFPRPVYVGIELTKKLEPRKIKSVQHIHGNKGVELIALPKESQSDKKQDTELL